MPSELDSPTFFILSHSNSLSVCNSLTLQQPVWWLNLKYVHINNCSPEFVPIDTFFDNFNCAMDPQQNEHRRFRGFKVSSELQGVKDASLGYTMETIRKHCQKVTAQAPHLETNCINLNCAAQKYYIDCFEVLRDRKQCIRNLRFEVEQNGEYRLSHLKTD